MIHTDLENYGEAKAYFERAIEIWEAALGAEHPEVARSLGNLALVAMHEGDYATSQKLQQRSLAIREESLGADHPEVALALQGLTAVALSRESYAEAIALAERSLAIREDAGVAGYRVAQTQAVLARALWKRGRDRRHALDLAAKARDIYRAGAMVTPKTRPRSRLGSPSGAFTPAGRRHSWRHPDDAAKQGRKPPKFSVVSG